MTENRTRSVRKIDYLGAGLLCALVVLAVIGPIRSKLVERNRMIAERTSTLDDLAERETLESQLWLAREETEALRARISELHRSFPPRRELDSFISELNQLAESTGTDLIRVIPGDIREGEDFSRIAVQVEASARFDGFYRFLWGLGRMARRSQVENLKVSLDSSGRTCSIQMTLHIFLSARADVT